MQRPLTSRFTNGAVVEQRDIEIFLTLAEELHFGRTAERLHVSTARVSQTIKKLERRIGAALFERTSRRVTLTPVGRQLYADVGPAYRQLLAGIEHAVTAGRDIRGLLRVGFSAPRAAAWWSRWPTRSAPATPTARSGSGKFISATASARCCTRASLTCCYRSSASPA